MRTRLLLVAVATAATLLPACSRTDTNHAQANSADIRADSVPPVSPSVTQTSPPPLPPTPALPRGAGDAAPNAASASAAPAGNAPSSASNATKEASPPVNASNADNGKPGDAQDTAANNPAGRMTQGEESSSMPKAGQVNNYMSPALDTSSRGRSPQQ